MCAADQGRWEEYHSALFALQPAQETRDGFPYGSYTEAAEETGLSGESLASWEDCVNKDTYVDYVKSVDDQTVKDGITGTPAIFFADGSRIPGAIDLKALEGKFDSLEGKAGK